ncbi:gamma-glutamyl-gamma-aminobutyrate hydrolase family protein [Streptomyces thioluteus]|uniref:Gamma-glutamyl-gamma-aminobutyrate hydrolase family protein n=1 Tax=Streptomyces thioluteus TaxID=66431 RepID=A0ABN3WPV1_STRTU
MTLVGVTQRSLPPDRFGERRYALDARWFAFLAACGLTPVPLPNAADLALRTAGAADLRGVLLTGGDDLAEYGGPSPERDRTELRLLRWAVDRDVPVLGVCRGMQVILRAHGAPLVPVGGHVAVRHPVVTADGGRREVNSYHRMAARSVPAPLEVTARCGDVVEAVRHRAARVAGIMWHPERETAFHPDDVRAVGALLGGGGER